MAEQNVKLKKKMVDIMAGSAILMAFCSVLFATNAFSGSLPVNAYRNTMIFTLGLALATLVLNIMYFMGVFDKLSEKIFLRKNPPEQKKEGIFLTKEGFPFSSPAQKLNIRPWRKWYTQQIYLSLVNKFAFVADRKVSVDAFLIFGFENGYEAKS